MKVLLAKWLATGLVDGFPTCCLCRDKMFGMMTLCMVAMLALFYVGMIARDARCACRDGEGKKGSVCTRCSRRPLNLAFVSLNKEPMFCLGWPMK